MVFSINKITNYKILFCYKLLKNVNQYINNYGFIISIIIIICFIIFMIIVFITGNKQFKQYCYEVIEQRQLFIRTYNINHNKNVNNINKKKFKGVKNKKSKNFKNYNEPPKKKTNTENSKKSKIKIKIHQYSKDKNTSKEYGFSKSSLIKLNNIKDKDRLMNSPNNKKNKRFSIINRPYNKKNLYNARLRISLSCPIQKAEPNKTNIKLDGSFPSLCIKYVPLEKRSLYFCEEELNNLEYQHALEIDKRTYLDYYFSLFKKKNLILFCFFVYNKDYNIYCLKAAFFLCSFSLHFFINTLFFNDDTMHGIYEQEGVYDFLYFLPQIIYSTIIITIITTILKNLTLTQRDILNIKTINDLIKLKQVTFGTVKHVKIKIIIFFLLGFFILGFSYYYLSVFCVVYSNTQFYVIKDT